MLQEGLEPPTLGLLDPCSTKLSYQSWLPPSGFVPEPVAPDNARDHLRIRSPRRPLHFARVVKGPPAKRVSFARTGSNPVGVG